VKYTAMVDDEVFSKSINIAKWNIYMIAIADCAFYTFSYLISEKNLKENDCKEIYLDIIEKEKGKKNSKNLIIPTISALHHISSFVLSNEEQINFWQTGRAIKVDINYFKESKSFDYKKPIKVINKKQTLLGIGFLNLDQSNINPKLVLNAK